MNVTVKCLDREVENVFEIPYATLVYYDYFQKLLSPNSKFGDGIKSIKHKDGTFTYTVPVVTVEMDLDVFRFLFVEANTSICVSDGMEPKISLKKETSLNKTDLVDSLFDNLFDIDNWVQHTSNVLIAVDKYCLTEFVIKHQLKSGTGDSYVYIKSILKIIDTLYGYGIDALALLSRMNKECVKLLFSFDFFGDRIFEFKNKNKILDVYNTYKSLKLCLGQIMSRLYLKFMVENAMSLVEKEEFEKFIKTHFGIDTILGKNYNFNIFLLYTKISKNLSIDALNFCMSTMWGSIPNTDCLKMVLEIALLYDISGNKSVEELKMAMFSK